MIHTEVEVQKDIKEDFEVGHENDPVMLRIYGILTAFFNEFFLGEHFDQARYQYIWFILVTALNIYFL